MRNVYVAKILDDFFLSITAAAHLGPDIAFNVIKTIFNYIGVPLADDKSVAPCKRLVYLGLEIDVVNMCIRLPPDKEIQSLCGLLQLRVALSYRVGLSCADYMMLQRESKTLNI